MPQGEGRGNSAASVSCSWRAGLSQRFDMSPIEGSIQTNDCKEQSASSHMHYLSRLAVAGCNVASPAK